MENKDLPFIRQPTKSYVFHYPQAEEFFQQQEQIHWFPSEIKVEKDIQCILTELTPAEKHGVITVLKLFTLYELFVGHEYWSGTIGKIFPKPEIQQMAAYFAHIELGVHAPFYSKINKALMLDTDEFYTDYVNDPVLNDRMEFLEGYLTKAKTDPLLAVAVFSMIEGAVLYSSFAFLKHFSAGSKNKLTNIVAGINFSIRDEALHAQAAAWLFRQLKEESNLNPKEIGKLNAKITEAAHKVKEHEFKIAEKIFSQGPIEGITEVDLQKFISHRVDVCLQNLQVPLIGNQQESSIEVWFYEGVTGYIMHDFFNNVGREYTRNWIKDDFIWV